MTGQAALDRLPTPDHRKQQRLRRTRGLRELLHGPIYAGQATHVLIEVTGAVIGFAPTGASAVAAAPANRRLQRQGKQRDRLVNSIQNR